MKIGVLVSGQGTNLAALIAARDANTLAPAELAVVVSNIHGVPALARADAAGIPQTVVPHAFAGVIRKREEFEEQLLDVLFAHEVDAVVLAGFMRLLTPHFLDHFPYAIINTHPSLLPAFPGKDATEQAIAHGVKLAGVSVHFVDATLDGGPIIAQAAVPVLPDDDAASLLARIQAEEHRLLPTVVQRLAAGELTCKGRVVTIGAVRAE
ncbi:MAG TPA: phosphoribosylglycinamide formyltransferase [Kofleriaceae bacterium]